MERNDTQLVEDYLNGDNVAFSVITRRYLKSVYNFVYRLIGNAAEAEDVAQNVFLCIWKNLKHYKKEENFKTWIFSIARNAAIDFLRKKKLVTFSDMENESGIPVEEILESPEPLPDEIISQAEDKEMLEKLIKELPFIYREVLFLYYNNNFTFDEIGKIMDKPLNTVKSQHRRALIELRRLLHQN